MRKALITGINGQDGRYLRNFLIKKGYKVFGICNNLSDTDKVSLENENVLVSIGDISNQEYMEKTILEVLPDELYNLAAQSSVSRSYENYIESASINLLAVVQMLEIMRKNNIKCKFFQASSSEIFGIPNQKIANEDTEYNPCNPYGVSKLSAHLYVKNFRKWNNSFAVNGILFAHESPMRPEKFVTRKITKGIAEIVQGRRENILLGNIDIRRDWGYAGDYVEAIWLMLQQEEPDDYIISSGEAHSIREFLEIAFNHVGLDWERYIIIDSDLYRPVEYEELIGDNSKAKNKLKWSPKIKFEEVVKMMVYYDLNLLENN